MHDRLKFVDKPQKAYFPLLDLLRGPAALLVFLEHWRNLYFVDYVDLENPSIALKIFYLLSGAGHEAVMVFFVLSGCVIAHVISSMQLREKWSWSSYLSARLSRLWVVLIPALLLTALWDQIGMGLAAPDSPSIYDGAGFGYILNTPVSEISGLRTFLGNVFFLQTIVTSTFGSNGPMWSIAYEFVYYLAYPALVFSLFGRSFSYPRRAALLIASIGLLCFAGSAIAAAFPIWLAGAGAYWLFLRRPLPGRFASYGFWTGVFFVIVSITGSRIGFEALAGKWNSILAVTTALTVYCGLSAQVSHKLLFWTSPILKLSTISYSLYLLHNPLLVFLASRLFKDNADRWLPSANNLLFALGVAVIVFVYCIGVWFLTEKQTKTVRRLIDGLVKKKRHAVAGAT